MALIFMLLEKVFCWPPRKNTPKRNKASPSSKNMPTMIARLLSLKSILCGINLIYKIIIVKRFYPFIVCRKNFVESTYTLKLPVKQHRNTVAGFFGAG